SIRRTVFELMNHHFECNNGKENGHESKNDATGTQQTEKHPSAGLCRRRHAALRTDAFRMQRNR
ncbi:MAG: hypothetical protein KBS57_06175, partial [Alistipes sp.]|nr:hypothetical protein [Candidatus Minthomonas equi]